jgi:hypothetical protein
VRELGLAGAVMSEGQQANHGAAGLLLALFGQERLEGAGISAALEQLIAIDQIEQCGVLATCLRRPTPPQGQQMRRAEEAIEPIVVEPPGIRRLRRAQTISFNVRSGCTLINARIWRAYFPNGNVLPPRGNDSQVPSSRKRCIQRMAELALTSNRSALRVAILLLARRQ